MERRKEKRLAISNHYLPFIGCKENNGKAFIYVLLNISRGGLRFAIPPLRQETVDFTDGERINFYIPFDIDGKTLDTGTIVRVCDDQNHMVYAVELDGKASVTRKASVDGESAAITLALDGDSTRRELVSTSTRQACREMTDLVSASVAALDDLRSVQPTADELRYWMGETARIHSALSRLGEKLRKEAASGDSINLIDLNEFIGLLGRAILSIPDLSVSPGKGTAALRQSLDLLHARHNELVLLYIDCLDLNMA